MMPDAPGSRPNLWGANVGDSVAGTGTLRFSKSENEPQQHCRSDDGAFWAGVPAQPPWELELA